MTTLETARSRIASVGWLARQPADFTQAFLAAATLRTYGPGETVNSLGDPPRGLFGVVDGFVDVLIAPGPFPPRLAHLARSGWWVGEAAEITATARRVALIARSPAAVLHVPEAALGRLAAEDPAVWKRVGALTVAHLDNALMLAGGFADRDLRLRLAVTIHRLSGADALCDVVDELPLTREEIGEIAGLSRNTAGRLLAELARDGLISLRYGRLTILAPERLAAMAMP